MSIHRTTKVVCDDCGEEETTFEHVLNPMQPSKIQTKDWYFLTENTDRAMRVLCNKCAGSHLRGLL
jgi:ribosomal protein S27E